MLLFDSIKFHSLDIFVFELQIKLCPCFRSREHGRRRSHDQDSASVKDEVKDDVKTDTSKTRKASFLDTPRRLLVPLTVKTDKLSQIYPETKVCKF